MHFALVCLFYTVTAVSASERMRNSVNMQRATSLPFNLICPGQRVETASAQATRKLLPKGRESVTEGRLKNRAYHRGNRDAFHAPPANDGAETMRGTSAASEHRWISSPHGQHRSTDLDEATVGIRHRQQPSNYDSIPLKNLYAPDVLYVDGNEERFVYLPSISRSGSAQGNRSQIFSASSIARRQTPWDPSSNSVVERPPEQVLLYPQRLPATQLQGEVSRQILYNTGSRQHVKELVGRNEGDHLANHNQSASMRKRSDLGSYNAWRQTRSEYKARDAASLPMTEQHRSSEIRSRLTRKEEPRSSYQQQQLKGYLERDALQAAQEKTNSRVNQLQKEPPTWGFSAGHESSQTEERPPSARLPIFSLKSVDVHREDSMSDTFAAGPRPVGGRRKPAAARSHYSGVTSLQKENRAHRRPHRKDDSVSAGGTAIAGDTRNGWSDREKNRPPSQEMSISAMGLSDYELDVVEESLPMAKSVLDLGITDLQMLADMLYALKSAQYMQRLEEASKQQEVQEGMFFTKINRIQDRQKRQRRESDLKDANRLKTLEESLRLTKPFNAYYDTYLQEEEHNRKKMNLPGNRSQKKSDLTRRSPTAGERNRGQEVRRFSKNLKKGSWLERKRTQTLALALLESEEQGEVGGRRGSKFRRHGKRGTDGEGLDEVTGVFGDGGQVRETRPLAYIWEELFAGQGSKEQPLPVSETEGWPTLEQAKVGKKKKAATKGGGGNVTEKDRKETEAFTEKPDHSDQYVDQQELSALRASTQAEVEKKITAATRGGGGNVLEKDRKEAEALIEEPDPSDQYVDQHEVSGVQGQLRDTDAHPALSGPETYLERNTALTSQQENAENREWLTQKHGKAAQRIERETVLSNSLASHVDSGLSDELPPDTFLRPSNEVRAVSGEENALGMEILSAVIDGGGRTQKVLEEKMPEYGYRMHHKGNGQGFVATGESRWNTNTNRQADDARGDAESEKKPEEVQSMTSEAPLSATQDPITSSTFASDIELEGVEKPSSRERSGSEQRETAEDEVGVGSLQGKHSSGEYKAEPPVPGLPENVVANAKGRSTHPLHRHSGDADSDGTGILVFLEEEEVPLQLVDDVVTREVSLQSPAIVPVAHGSIGVPQEDVLLGKPGMHHLPSKTFIPEILSKSASYSHSQDSHGGSNELKETTAFLHTRQHVLEEATPAAEKFLRKPLSHGSLMLSETYPSPVFAQENLMLSDTNASPVIVKHSSEVPRKGDKVKASSRRYDHNGGMIPASQPDFFSISPSRLSRFRARHFGIDAAGKPEGAGQRMEKLLGRSIENSHGNKGKLAVLAEHQPNAFPYYRRLQFTSKNKTVLDRNTPAHLEFVDNDHGMQFVNWRSIDGERMVEKLWVNSMKEAERHQRKQVQREIESAFAKVRASKKEATTQNIV